MKDAARFALAIAAILSATALDAQQRSASEASSEAESETPTVPSRTEYAPPTKPEFDSAADGFASANGALSNESEPARRERGRSDRRSHGEQLDRDTTPPLIPLSSS